jgi:LemA protein
MMGNLGPGTVFAVIGGALLLLLIAMAVWLLVVYNRLVRRRNQVQASRGQIDVQLKRRHDLIPQLVETVRGYASHERSTLDAVIAARSGALAASGPPGAGIAAARADAENLLTLALGRLFALAEAYPNLKANESFAALQAELASTEDKISYARQFYNSAVQGYRNASQTFPTSLVAARMGFGAVDYFETAEADRAPVQVRF